MTHSFGLLTSAERGRKRLLAATLCLPFAVAALTLAAPATAGEDTARVDRLDKQMKEIRAIVFQARDTGHPVEVRPEGPDPTVTALSQRMDDLEAALRKLQGGAEQAGHDSDQTRAGLEAERTDRTSQVQALTDRLTRLESQIASLNAPPPPPPPPAGKVGKTAAVADPAPTDTGAEFKTARSLLASGDYGGASQAFQAFVSSHPTDARTPEAFYWLGESYYVRDLSGDATAAYARSLKGWPKTQWAPDATIKLARALAATQRNPEACAAIGEFTRRYEKLATASAKTRAAQTREKLGCGG